MVFLGQDIDDTLFCKAEKYLRLGLSLSLLYYIGQK